MEDTPSLDDLPWWRPAVRRAVRWLLAVAFAVGAAVAFQAKLLGWFWLDEATLLGQLRYLTFGLHLSTVMLSWLGTLSALAFGLWMFERSCRRELQKHRNEAAEWLALRWDEELRRRSAKFDIGEEPGVPAEEVLTDLRAELEEERDDEESKRFTAD